MLDNTISPIDSFPNDNKLRVVWAYGAILKNTGTTRVPEIEIMLREILNKNELSDTLFFTKISVAQLDVVRYMTVWMGNRRITRKWEIFNLYSKNRLFTLDTTSASSISLTDKKENTDYTHFPPYKYHLPYIDNKHMYWNFANATFTKIKSNEGHTIIIPSMELLTSTYVPEEQKIRNKLLQKNLDDVLDEYIKSSKIKSNTYSIELYENKFETNEAFLAYAKFNIETRRRLSKLRSSLEKESPYQERYPIVLPYHPASLSVQGDGVWMDKETFFMFRINNYSLPTDVEVESLIVEIVSEDNSSEGMKNNHRKAQKEIEDDIPITNEHNPHINNGSKHIRSEVGILNPGIIKHRKRNVNKTANKNTSSEHENIENIENISSSDANQSMNSEKTSNIKNIPRKNTVNLDQSSVLRRVIDALYYLRDEKVDISDKQKIYIEEIYFLNEHCSLHKDETISQFYIAPKYTKNSAKTNNNSWIEIHKNINGKRKFIRYRGYLLIKIIFTNGKHIYLFEVDRKNAGEAFLGMFFSLSSEISINTLSDLLFQVVDTHGVLKNVTLPGMGKSIFKHRENNKKTLNDNIENSIKRAIKNKVPN